MFQFSFATEVWTNTTDLKSWKLMPYPKPSGEPFSGTMLSSSDTTRAGEETRAYFHVDISYPIAARNVPMVKMCLDQGVDVNAVLPRSNYEEMTPLMKAVVTAYEVTSYDTITTILLMRRNARKIVQLLLDHGAEKSPEARSFAGVLRGHGHQPDWLIEQLLDPFPHADLGQCIAMTDAVWAGEQEKLEDIITQEPEILYASELHGVSPLGIAVNLNDERMVKMLLFQGASPNALDPIGSSPLAIAVASNLEVMAKLLLQCGASITLFDPILGLNPLEYATREGYHTMCGILLENETARSPSDKKKLLSKPLVVAIRYYHVDVVVVLLEHGANACMDMWSFLRPEEKKSYTERVYLTPRLFLENKLIADSDGVYNPTFKQALHAIFERYESQTNTEISQRSTKHDSPQSGDVESLI
jgi:ankyrin repeat protein